MNNDLYVAFHGSNKLFWDGDGFTAVDSHDAMPMVRRELDALLMAYCNVQYRTTRQQFAWEKHYQTAQP